MFGCPIQLIWADSLKLVELRIEDTEVQVVAKINPGKDEEAEVWPNEWMVQVVEGFGCLEIFSEDSFVRSLFKLPTAKVKSLKS